MRTTKNATTRGKHTIPIQSNNSAKKVSLTEPSQNLDKMVSILPKIYAGMISAEKTILIRKRFKIGHYKGLQRSIFEIIKALLTQIPIDKRRNIFSMPNSLRTLSQRNS